MIETLLQCGFGGAALIILHQFKAEVRSGFAALGTRLDDHGNRLAALERPLGFRPPPDRTGAESLTAGGQGGVES